MLSAKYGFTTAITCFMEKNEVHGPLTMVSGMLIVPYVPFTSVVITYNGQQTTENGQLTKKILAVEIEFGTRLDFHVSVDRDLAR